MINSHIKETVRRYYQAWAAQDRAQARNLLHDSLVFTSTQDKYTSGASFLSACWVYSKGLVSVQFIREVYQDDEAFVILRWLTEDGSNFAGAEYLRVADEKISHILVVNNDPSFDKMLK